MSDFKKFLESVPVLYGLLSAAVAAAVSFLLPDRILPEPVDGLDQVAGLLVAVAFLIGWVWRDRVRPRLRAVTLACGVMGVVLLFLNAFLVCPVEYAPGGELVERVFLTGWAYADPGLEGLGCSEAIRMMGPDGLVAAWGWSHRVTVILYLAAFVGLVFGLVLALSAIQTEQPRAD